ncbi:DUF1800 family protein [Streptomyces globisporus]|uniref:DUF1800 family protein n=1 Tax=Streptomyces globisporus TaxID=1908 RepID=UPI000D14E199|nr:DUF1800 family protein [Streptomyces globisporus]
MGRTLDTRARVTRLLQRAGFDAGADAVDAAARAGFDATLDRVLGEAVDGGVDATPAPRLGPLPPRNAEAREKQKGRGEDRPAGRASDPAPPVPGAGGTADAAGEAEGAADPVRKAYRQALREQREELTVWWLDRMVAVEHPWEEKRTLLWHNHWATSIQKVKSGAAMLQQNETLRRLGGGDFRGLARAMVVDPALMVWLDAGGSTAKAPNENLARELMELFVLGVGNYTETDVRQAAAVLTGWTVDRSENPWEARTVSPTRSAVEEGSWPKWAQPEPPSTSSQSRQVSRPLQQPGSTKTVPVVVSVTRNPPAANRSGMVSNPCRKMPSGSVGHGPCSSSGSKSLQAAIRMTAVRTSAGVSFPFSAR